MMFAYKIATFSFLHLDLGQTVLKMQDSNLFHDEGITLFGSLVGVKLHRSSIKKIQQQQKVLRQQNSLRVYHLIG